MNALNWINKYNICTISFNDKGFMVVREHMNLAMNGWCAQLNYSKSERISADFWFREMSLNDLIEINGICDTNRTLEWSILSTRYLPYGLWRHGISSLSNNDLTSSNQPIISTSESIRDFRPDRETDPIRKTYRPFPVERPSSPMYFSHPETNFRMQSRILYWVVKYLGIVPRELFIDKRLDVQ